MLVPKKLVCFIKLNKLTGIGLFQFSRNLASFHSQNHSDKHLLPTNCERNGKRFLQIGNSLPLVKEIVRQKSSDTETQSSVSSTDATKNPSTENRVKVYFESLEGERMECLAPIGISLMHACVDEQVAMEGCCQGGLACNICHVYVEEAYLKFMPEISEEEQDMLDIVPNWKECSRLTCQIPVAKELEGAVFIIPTSWDPFTRRKTIWKK